MTTTTRATTTNDEPCAGCDQADGVCWVTSTADTDTWACRHCGIQWTITVQVAGSLRRLAGRYGSWSLVVGRGLTKQRSPTP